MKSYYRWFEEYLEKYLRCGKENVLLNCQLKKEHTFRVKDNILKIGKALNLDENSLMLCELIGLFHDVGRFKQYGEYGTFSDTVTGSHAELSVQVLLKNNALNNLSESEKHIVIKAIQYHNYFSVPDNEAEEIKLFTRLIRDADKLDAFYVETDENEQRKYDLGELLTEKDYSEEVISDILNNRQVDFKNIKYKYDRQLSVLGFIFDMFYKESYKIFQEQKYLLRILRKLPNDACMKMLYVHCEKYIANKIC